MAEKIKNNTNDKKYFDGKKFADYLNKELKRKGIKVKFEKGKESGKGAIKIMGNPSKITGVLPDGWSYDAKTNRFRNGNKADAEYFDVKPLKSDKPIKNIVDMSDVMYTIKCKRPDIKLKALDTTSFGIDGTQVTNIDWKGIFGSKFKFDKETGTIQGETNEGIKLAFNVMGEKFENRKFETVSENKYTSNTKGIMSSGFSEGNRKSVEHTADYLLKNLANMDSNALIFNADMESFDVAEARFLFNTCNLVPDPRGEGLAVQERETGVIYSDPQKVARLAIVYNMTELVDGGNTIENNPLLDTVTRGEVNWENFDNMFNAFADNPELLNVAIEKSSDSLARGDRSEEIREDVKEVVEAEQKSMETPNAEPKEEETKKVEETLEKENNTEESPQEEDMEKIQIGEDTVVAFPTQKVSIGESVEIALKNGGGEVSHLNIADDKYPMSFEQIMSLGDRYAMATDNGVIKGVYNRETGVLVSENMEIMVSWLLVRESLLTTENSKEYWENLIESGKWQEVAYQMSLSAKSQKEASQEMDDEPVMEMKSSNDNE